MKPRKRLPKSKKIAGDEDRQISIKGLLKPPKSRAAIRKTLLRMDRRFGLTSPQWHWRLASWFVSFVDSQELSRFKEEAEFLGSTKGGSALKEGNIDEALRMVQADAKTIIKWYLDEKAQDTKESHAPPLDPSVNVELRPRLTEGRFETYTTAQDLRARLLLLLFDLLSAEKRAFARCESKSCRKNFAPRGRQLYCSTGCADRSRPVEKRRNWMRDYMRERRATLKRYR